MTVQHCYPTLVIVLVLFEKSIENTMRVSHNNLGAVSTMQFTPGALHSSSTTAEAYSTGTVITFPGSTERHSESAFMTGPERKGDP